MSKVERPILMVPGPSEVPAGVLTAVSLHPMPYYGRRWGKIFEEVREMAKKPFGSSGEILLIPASCSGDGDREPCSTRWKIACDR